MTLLLSLDALARRKRELQADPTAMGGLARSLQRELHDALDVPVPDGKSRLTRTGGRCPRCTVLLTFDPRQPHTHACPVCSTGYGDHVHHEWWLMNAHLWTAEQCTRAAALAYLLDDAPAARRADEILQAYGMRYASWPNRDNALGPTRPFFSTYLESIWLLHLCVALDLRETADGRDDERRGDVRQRVILPSVRLIASFDEGRSNRQAWHCAARLAAAGLLAGTPDAQPAMQHEAVRSLEFLLRDGLHADGSWYEGENYHLFAHRGLLSAVTLAEHAGFALPAELVQRFESGFAAPFRTMLPDGTFPARRDSQYGITLRQYRTADWLECGFARRDAPELRAALAMLYAEGPAGGSTGRAVSTADAERNQPAVRLTRADCNWRTLLLGRLELPSLADATPRSELLEGQGLAVFRRDGGRLWVGLDYGDPGAGHGHPDRLNLVIATPDARWLDDMGTGSYTSPSLSWYRSSMAHNAPFVDGRDQGAARGHLLAHDEQGETGWVSADFVDPVTGVRFVRTIVVMVDHVIDEVVWTSATEVVVDVPLQAVRVTDDADENADAMWSSFAPMTAQDASLAGATSRTVPAGMPVALDLRGVPSPTGHGAPHATVDFTCLMWSGTRCTLWQAATLGPPAGLPHGMVAMRQQGRSGRSARVIAARGVIDRIECDAAAIVVHHRVKGRFRHERRTDQWCIASPDGVTRSLGGARDVAPLATAHRAAAVTAAESSPLEIAPGTTLRIAIEGPSHYRPTEESHAEAGSPTAIAHVLPGPRAVTVIVDVQLYRAPAFAAACAENPLDNEPADVNSDGVQLHWRSLITGAWNTVIAVPEPSGAVRLTPAEGGLDGLAATWQVRDRGYEVVFTLPRPADAPSLHLDVCVNDRPAGRERRRGQLVLTGAHGESAYLRGARQDPARALHIVFRPEPS